jgi:hypothetical protein
VKRNRKEEKVMERKHVRKSKKKGQKEERMKEIRERKNLRDYKLDNVEGGGH